MGRPRKPEGEKVERVVAYLEPRLVRHLERLGGGSASAGVKTLAAESMRLAGGGHAQSVNTVTNVVARPKRKGASGG